MPKFTKGPWHRQDTADYAEIKADNPNECLAMAAKAEDATLIAAAPDLYAALKEMVEFYNSDGLEPDSTPCLKAALALRRAIP